MTTLETTTITAADLVDGEYRSSAQFVGLRGESEVKAA